MSLVSPWAVMLILLIVRFFFSQKAWQFWTCALQYSMDSEHGRGPFWPVFAASLWICFCVMMAIVAYRCDVWSKECPNVYGARYSP
jgi:hypothetical protein